MTSRASCLWGQSASPEAEADGERAPTAHRYALRVTQLMFSMQMRGERRRLQEGRRMQCAQRDISPAAVRADPLTAQPPLRLDTPPAIAGRPYKPDVVPSPQISTHLFACSHHVQRIRELLAAFFPLLRFFGRARCGAMGGEKIIGEMGSQRSRREGMHTGLATR